MSSDLVQYLSTVDAAADMVATPLKDPATNASTLSTLGGNLAERTPRTGLMSMPFEIREMIIEQYLLSGRATNRNCCAPNEHQCYWFWSDEFEERQCYWNNNQCYWNWPDELYVTDEKDQWNPGKYTVTKPLPVHSPSFLPNLGRTCASLRREMILFMLRTTRAIRFNLPQVGPGGPLRWFEKFVDSINVESNNVFNSIRHLQFYREHYEWTPDTISDADNHLTLSVQLIKKCANLETLEMMFFEIEVPEYVSVLPANRRNLSPGGRDALGEFTDLFASHVLKDAPEHKAFVLNYQEEIGVHNEYYSVPVVRCNCQT